MLKCNFSGSIIPLVAESALLLSSPYVPRLKEGEKEEYDTTAEPDNEAVL